ncbi:hypothetical protein GIB67_030131 [Kingdonia uniflora]|uniref:Uncharacterized protein n=1 Tax=Kingdonia uniflora TaxID=39325 RepID=A0A7J7LC16_9MAGN|nr:hypothetical protein GIB67_030131 [Kingdonia uniflora]
MVNPPVETEFERRFSHKIQPQPPSPPQRQAQLAHVPGMTHTRILTTMTIEYLDLNSPGSMKRVVWEAGRPTRAKEPSFWYSSGLEGAYTYVSELWRKKHSDVMRFLQRVYVIYRVRVRRGGRKRPVSKGIVYGNPRTKDAASEPEYTSGPSRRKHYTDIIMGHSGTTAGRCKRCAENSAGQQMATQKTKTRCQLPQELPFETGSIPEATTWELMIDQIIISWGPSLYRYQESDKKLMTFPSKSGKRRTHPVEEFAFLYVND